MINTIEYLGFFPSSFVYQISSNTDHWIEGFFLLFLKISDISIF